MMTFMEISTYLGMANILLKQAEVEDDTDIMTNIRQAICEAQLYFAKKGLDIENDSLYGWKELK